MPFLILALLAGVALYEVEKRRQQNPALPPAPGPAPLPPVNAPPAAIAMYQQALSSNDPVQMVQIATALYGQGQPALAAAINQRYQQLTNNPIPGIPVTAGLVGARLDPHTVMVLASHARARRARRAQVLAHLRAAQLRRQT